MCVADPADPSCTHGHRFSPALLQELRQLFSESNRYKNYRAALKQVAGVQPSMPHLAIHLSDLTFMEVSGAILQAGEADLPPPSLSRMVRRTCCTMRLTVSTLASGNWWRL